MIARRSKPLLLAASLVSLWASGCGGEEPEPEAEPPIEGVALYELHPGLCGGPPECWSYGLFRGPGPKGELVELRAYDGGEYRGRAQADLKAEAAVELDARTAEVLTGLEAGEIDPERADCEWFDGSHHLMFVGEYELSYALHCAPPGTEALDALLLDMTHDLRGCHVSPELSPKIGCEPLDPWDP